MPTWTTRDGRSIDMREMADDHLANAIDLMKRRLIAGLRKLDELEAEKKNRIESHGWRLVAEGDDFAPTGDGIVAIFHRRDATRPEPLFRIEVRALWSIGSGWKGFELAWLNGDRRLCVLRGDDWPAMVLAAKAVDAACFLPRRP